MALRRLEEEEEEEKKKEEQLRVHMVPDFKLLSIVRPCFAVDMHRVFYFRAVRLSRSGSAP